jgi:GDP-L-fucose synthase
MKIVILGGHGFVGKALRVKHQAADHEIIRLSRRDGLDLTDFDATVAAFVRENPDVIYNCAAHVGSLHHVTEFAASVVHDNMQMALNIYRAAIEACPKTRIVNPLSNCSYPGDADVHYEPDWWKGEVHHSVYSYGNPKRFIYVLAKCYNQQHGLRSTNLLVPNTFGPGDSTDPNKTHALNGMIIRMIQAQREGKKQFEIWGTGKPVREWGYIEDVVEIMKQVLDREDLLYPMNIAQNRGFSIKESAEAIGEALNFEGELIFNTKYQDGAARKILDDRKFREIFPEYKFADHSAAIRDTVEYYKQVL